jgi:CheY-like chemotaxis protein
MPDGGCLRIETANVALDESSARDAALAPGPYIRLAVADTGCGMPPEVVERIFEPFFTTKGEGKGTGLGLSTVYGIVHQSGGHIEVESGPGRGSRFSIYLPVVAEAADERSPADTPAQYKSRGETVLLVEDADLVRRVAADILTAQGYRVVAVSSAEEALELLGAERAEAVQLMLTDVVLPGMNGLELSRRVAAERPRLKTILMSGYSDHELLRDGLKPEEAFLHKPFSPFSLLQKVRGILDSAPRPVG